jgi:hypothetical protein
MAMNVKPLTNIMAVVMIPSMFSLGGSTTNLINESYFLRASDLKITSDKTKVTTTPINPLNPTLNRSLSIPATP